MGALISGLYDLPAFLDEPRTTAAAAIRATTLAPTDGSPAARLGHEIPFAMREPLVSAFIDATLRR